MDGASEFSGEDPLNSLLEPEGSNAHLGLYLLGFLMVVGGVILFFMGLYLLGLAGLRGIGVLALVVMVFGVFDVVLGVGVFRHRLWAVRVYFSIFFSGGGSPNNNCEGWSAIISDILLMLSVASSRFLVTFIRF